MRIFVKTRNKIASSTKNNFIIITSEMADEQCIKTSDEELYFANHVEEVHLFHHAHVNENVKKDYNCRKVPKGSGSSTTIISTER